MKQEELKQRLIEVLEELMGICECSFGEKTPTFEQSAKFLIANGVTIRERGEWKTYPSDAYMKCSVCGMEYLKTRMPQTVGYCPNPHCGADMRGAE